MGHTGWASECPECRIVVGPWTVANNGPITNFSIWPNHFFQTLGKLRFPLKGQCKKSSKWATQDGPINAQGAGSLLDLEPLPTMVQLHISQFGPTTFFKRWANQDFHSRANAETPTMGRIGWANECPGCRIVVGPWTFANGGPIYLLWLGHQRAIQKLLAG